MNPTSNTWSDTLPHMVTLMITLRSKVRASEEITAIQPKYHGFNVFSLRTNNPNIPILLINPSSIFIMEHI